MKRWLVLLGFWAAAGLQGCLGETQQAGCASDDECAGDRICSSARCVDPPEEEEVEADSGADVDDADDDEAPGGFVRPGDDEATDDDDEATDDDPEPEPEPADDDPVDDDDPADVEPEPEPVDDEDISITVPVTRDRDAGVASEEACADVTCDDAIECTVDRCDEATGSCAFEGGDCECAEDEDCADPDAPECVVSSCDPETRTCATGITACECTEASDCTDADPCTVEDCVDHACQATVAVGAQCDDGIACTSPDVCRADGSCAGDDAACTPTPPPSWGCNAVYYGDGSCDCGCGAIDVDCASTAVGACGTCTRLGSCASSCSDIQSTDSAVCVSAAPPQWTCSPEWYGDTDCDCGCGIVDVDCADALVSSCEFCDLSGSCAEGDVECTTIDPTNNHLCEQWSCLEEWYGDGDCDCGCGVVDVDCSNSLASSCDFCGLTGSCAAEDCGNLVPDDNASCQQGVWACDQDYFDDGVICDCGCGAPDPDCTSSLPDACEFCGISGSCADGECNGLDPNDNAVCAP